MCVCCFRRCDHFFIVGIQSSVTNVFHDRTVKQPGVLQHHTETLSQISPVKFPDIVSVDQYPSTVDIIETHQQFHQRGFSGTGRSNDGDFLSRLYLFRKIFDNDLIRPVAKAYMFKGYVSFHTIFQCHRMFHRLFFFLFFQEFKDTLGSCGCGLHHVSNLCDLLYRLGKVSDVLEERLNITDFNSSFDSHKATEKSYHYVSDITYKLHDRHHHAGEKL